MTRVGAWIAAAALVMFSAPDASAHALAQRYDLPLPLGYFLIACATAVALSFVIASLLLRKRGWTEARANYVAVWLRLPSVLTTVLRIVAVATTAFLVVAGLSGNPNTFKNITPVAFWVIWWVGFGFITAFVGNLWPLINPWLVIFDWAEKACPSLASLRLRYPPHLTAWPACVLLILFSWWELVAPGRDVPANIAIAIILYSFVTWTGLALFGRASWLQNVEVFSLLFGILGRFAPLTFKHAKGHWFAGGRPYAVGLLTAKPLSASMSAFVLLMLATVTVDGIMETPQWSAVVDSVLNGRNDALAYAGLQTLLLLLGPIMLACLYLITTALMTRISGAEFRQILGTFALSLVPIAIAYHLAHYFSLFALAGQFIIPLISDPFGYGWDLFGTTLYRIDIGIVDAKTIWYLSVFAIVTGHVIAVWIAHAAAAARFSDSRTVIESQYPMLALMVGYTTLSLWILAQPIVEPGPR